MLKILSIGNSFSQDAHRYLSGIAKNEGAQIKNVNLYIGGCSLYKHYINMLEDRVNYDFEFKGEYTGLKVSIAQLLASDEWDCITLQQVSQSSPFYDTYLPYLPELADYVRMYNPKTKLFIHQTWAYEQGSERLNGTCFDDQHQMLDKIKESYALAAKEIEAAGIIPCGEAMMSAIDSGIGRMHRDGFHADLGIGRYLLGLIWYKTLFGETAKNDFTDFDIPVEREKAAAIRELANKL